MDEYWNACNKSMIPLNMSIIKVRDSNEILEGYNLIEWKSDFSGNSYGITKDSFIFSFKDKENN